MKGEGAGCSSARRRRLCVPSVYVAMDGCGRKTGFEVGVSENDDDDDVWVGHVVFFNEMRDAISEHAGWIWLLPRLLSPDVSRPPETG